MSANLIFLRQANSRLELIAFERQTKCAIKLIEGRKYKKSAEINGRFLSAKKYFYEE